MAQSNLRVFLAHDFPQPLTPPDSSTEEPFDSNLIEDEPATFARIFPREPFDGEMIENLILIVERTEKPELGDRETPEPYFGALEVDRG